MNDLSNSLNCKIYYKTGCDNHLKSILKITTEVIQKTNRFMRDLNVIDYFLTHLKIFVLGARKRND